MNFRPELNHVSTVGGGHYIGVKWPGSRYLSLSDLVRELQLEPEIYRKLFDGCHGEWRAAPSYEFFLFDDVLELKIVIDKIESLLVMKELVGETKWRMN